MHTDNYRGRVSKTALVTTNDPENGKLRIKIEGTIEQLFKADPKDMFTVFTQPGKAFNETITLTNNLDEPMIINGMEHNLGQEAKVEFKTLEKGRKYEVSISGKIDKPMTKGGLIQLKLVDAPMKALKLRAFINIRDSAPKGYPKVPAKSGDKPKTS